MIKATWLGIVIKATRAYRHRSKDSLITLMLVREEIPGITAPDNVFSRFSNPLSHTIHKRVHTLNFTLRLISVEQLVLQVLCV